MLFRAYLETAKLLVQAYPGHPPLATYLQAYFKQHRQFGSRDRKAIADLVFGFFRLGKQAQLSHEEAITIGALLKSRLPITFFETQATQLVAAFELSLSDKMAWLQTKFDVQFDVPMPLSEGFTQDDFFEQLYGTPRVFLRLREPHRVMHALEKADIPYTLHEDILSVASNTQLDKLLREQDYVIQDWASQQTGHFWEVKPNSHWWDCCAASGGKSLRLLDKHIPIKLSVSDVRESILRNLDRRMKIYGYRNAYSTHVLDLMLDAPLPGPFDAIIADVPCSGSGTWGRNADGFYFTGITDILDYQQKQIRIASRVAKSLKQGGRLYYITCSVFAAENEEAIQQVMLNTGLQLREQHIIHQSGIGADALFTAVLEKV